MSKCVCPALSPNFFVHGESGIIRVEGEGVVASCKDVVKGEGELFGVFGDGVGEGFGVKFGQDFAGKEGHDFVAGAVVDDGGGDFFKGGFVDYAYAFFLCVFNGALLLLAIDDERDEGEEDDHGEGVC